MVHGHDIWSWNNQLVEPVDLILYIESFVLNSSMVAECSCTANFIMFIIVFATAKLTERSLRQSTSRSMRGREPIWQMRTRSSQMKWRRWDLYRSQKHLPMLMIFISLRLFRHKKYKSNPVWNSPFSSGTLSPNLLTFLERDGNHTHLHTIASWLSHCWLWTAR